jgi:hypothetical protein
MRRQWAIFSFSKRFPHAGGVIETSRGRPYAELRKIAKQLNFSGDGQRYEVRESFLHLAPLVKDKL